VTPAPIRRPSFWGDDRDEASLPAAEGVPKQEDWVRRFTSYPTPAFPALTFPLHDLRGKLSFQCQYCGTQNPVAKLEELQRLQSGALLSPTGTKSLDDIHERPKRKMPESESLDAVIEADNKATSPIKTAKVPKPILKAPHFELGNEMDDTPETAGHHRHEEGPLGSDDPPSPTSTRDESTTDARAGVAALNS
jgi:hypothetical protein